MHNQLELFLLGNPEVRLDGTPITRFRSSKTQALLYYLAVTGRPHTRLALAGLLWGDLSDTQARLSLTQCLSNLRQLVGDYIIIERQSAAFNRAKLYWLDVETFVAGAGSPHPEAAIQQQRAAVDLYRGDFLAGFYVRDAPEFETWALAEQAQLRKLAVQAIQTLATHHTRQGDLEQAITDTRRLLSLEPWHEEAHRQLMGLLAQNGQRSAALEQYAVCRRILQAELAVEPAVETVALYEGIRTRKFDNGLATLAEPVSRSAGQLVTPSPLHNLPSQLTPFIGRKQELADILRRLQDPTCRLLTVVGPGGMGKSRLAMQAAQLLPPPPHGVWFVQLAPVTTANGMVAAIAEALNFVFYSNVPPRQQLLDYLREKALLLVLDNFEHLLPSVDLISDILAVAPAVKILVTSRAALNLQEAWFHPIAGLPYPEPTAVPGEVVETYDAVQLFVQCARRTRVSFALAAEQESVVRICQLVEGMPLGIELATTWLKMLPCEQIAQEIQRSLDFLTTRLHNVPARQRSMRAVFEQSWQLLSEDERAVLGRLSVLRGFRQEAAEQVAGASLSLLAGLVEKALVRATLTGRYQMHELLRQFAAEKLAMVSVDQATTENRHSHDYLALLQALQGKEQRTARGEEAQIRERHCDYYAAYLHQRKLDLKSKREKEILVEIEAEIDNIQAGWHWAVARGHHTAIELYLDSLLAFYIVRGWYQEGADGFGKAVAALRSTADPIETVLLGKLLTAQGVINGLAHQYESSKTCLEESLGMLQRLGARHAMAYPLQELGNLAVFRGRFAEAKPLFEQSLTLYTECNDRYGIMKGLSQLGWAMLKLGESEAATTVLQQSLTLFRVQGPPSGMVWVVKDLGDIALGQGKYVEALAYYQESLTISAETKYALARAYSLGALGWVYLDLGDYPKAEQYYQESLLFFRGLGRQPHVTWTLSMLSYAAILNDKLAAAKAYLDEVVSIQRNTESKEGWWYCCVQGELALVQGDAGGAEAYFQSSIALFEDIDDISAYRGGLAWPLNGLGRAVYLRKDYARCRQKFQEALLMAQQAPSVPEAFDILAGMATLLATGDEPARAVELVGYIMNCPASRKCTQKRTQQLLAEITLKLSPSELSVALNKGRDKGINEIYAGLYTKEC